MVLSPSFPLIGGLAASWAALGNVVGGVGLVTVLRLLQVPHKVEQERAEPALGVPLGDHRRADED